MGCRGSKGSNCTMAVQIRGRWVFWAAPNPTAWVRTGTQTSLFHFHWWWERYGADSASGGLEWAGEPALAMGQLWCISSSPACSKLELKAMPKVCVSRSNTGKTYAQSCSGVGNSPACREWLMTKVARGHIQLYQTITQVSWYSQCRKTKRIICLTYLKSLVRVQVGQVCPTGGCHLVLPAFSPGIEWFL